MPVTLRPYRRKDWAAVKAIADKSFGSAYDVKYLRLLVADKGRVVTVAERRKRVVGFTVLRTAPHAYLDTVAVVPHSRRTGIGGALIEAAEQQAKAHGCTTLFLDIHRAGPLGWYQRRGFSVARQTGFVNFKDGTRSELLAKGLYWGQAVVVAPAKKSATAR
jgi:[ribosomal protein S18]-alanine N-acetyltransferase